jgi:hypothetical protein
LIILKHVTVNNGSREDGEFDPYEHRVGQIEKLDFIDIMESFAAAKARRVDF